MPTWLIAESAFQTLLILSGMKNGARIDEIRAITEPAPTGATLDRMAAHGWVTLDGEFHHQRRYKITQLGRSAAGYAHDERTARKVKR